MQKATLVMLGVLLAGCASGLQYKPQEPVPGVRLSADYTVLQDQLQVEVATDGSYRVERAVIVTPGGEVEPADVIHAPARGGGVDIGVGVGGGSGGVGGGVGVGTSTGGSNDYAHTVVYFDRAQVGDAPWTFKIKLVGYPVATIILPAR